MHTTLRTERRCKTAGSIIFCSVYCFKSRETYLDADLDADVDADLVADLDVDLDADLDADR